MVSAEFTGAMKSLSLSLSLGPIEIDVGLSQAPRLQPGILFLQTPELHLRSWVVAE